MAGNKPNVKLQRAKIRPASSPSPAGSPTSEDVSASPPDLSVLRKSIKTSVTGFSHARNVYDTGTNELKQLLSSECDIIYECRVCRNLFRSLANFISHKRVYCSDKFDTTLHPHFNNDNHTRDDVGTILQYEEEYQEFVRNKDKILNDGSTTDNVRKKNSATKDLTSIIEKLLQKTQREKDSGNQTNKQFIVPMRHIKFQSIPDSDSAIYQNVYTNEIDNKDFMKNQIAELDRLISSNEAILGPDGKLLSRDRLALSTSNGNADVGGDSQIDLFCDICKINFATKKTLQLHMKMKHAENRLVYPCPDCADTFSNSWSVFRHLFRVHRKSATHIRKLRETIQNKAFKMNMSTINENKRKTGETNRESITEQQRMDQENQAWIDNLEGDGDIPRCGGCGKRFERRAALSAHRQTCQLRKSAQNKINTSLQRRTLPKPVTKDSEETLSGVTLKVAKIEKPTERKIEIKIRRDYNKASPLSIRTNSPALADDETNMEPLDNIDSTNISNVIGENTYDFSSINFSNSDIQHDSNFMETVKDCDDANVDENFEKNTDNSSNIDKERIFTDDGDLNFDDIRRICHEDSSQMSNKACGQNKIISNLKVHQMSYTDIDNLFIKSNNTSDSVGNEDTFTVNIDTISEIQDSNSAESFDDNDIMNKFKCEYCNLKFKLKEKLERHIMRHLKLLECKECGIKSCNSTQFEIHMKSHQLNSQPQPLLKCRSKEALMNDSVVCKENVEDSRDNIPNEEVFDENSGQNELPKIKIEVEDELSESTSDYQKLSSQVEKYKPRPSYKQLKKKRRLMKKSQAANQKKSAISEDSLNSSDHLQFAPFSNLEPMMEEVIGKIKNTIPIKLKEKSIKSGIKLKSILTKDSSNISYKKCNQHIASSESYTVQRPVRNRVKLFDKDFEYDSSYLPRLKAENRESSITTVLSPQKPQLKRKQFLQSEMLAAELSKPWEEMDQIKEKDPPLIPKLYQGALQTISLKVASKGRALLKAKQLAITRRNTPPYIRTPYRPVGLNTQKTITEKQTAGNHQAIPPDLGATGKIVLPSKTIPTKLVPSPSTVLKISEKSYLGKIQRKIGMPVTLLPQKLTVLTQKPTNDLMKSHAGVPKKLSTLQNSQTLPTKLRKNLDHQALNSKVTYQTGEITMLTKSQLKEKTSDSSSSLSILPSNGNSNNSSFVNISLKQLKNMQKDHSPYHLSGKTLVKKNIFALKNLEDNNEIRISKVIHNKSQSNDLEINKISPIPKKDNLFKLKTISLNKISTVEHKSSTEKNESTIDSVLKDMSSDSSKGNVESVVNIFDDISEISQIISKSEDGMSPIESFSSTLNDNDICISTTDSNRKFYYNNKITNSPLKDLDNAFQETAKYASSNDDASQLD